MGRKLHIAVPPVILASVQAVRETLCINEWTLGLALLTAFCLGWLCVRLMDRSAR